jgi:hypothetical protein
MVARRIYRWTNRRGELAAWIISCWTIFLWTIRSLCDQRTPQQQLFCPVPPCNFLKYIFHITSSSWIMYSILSQVSIIQWWNTIISFHWKGSWMSGAQEYTSNRAIPQNFTVVKHGTNKQNIFDSQWRMIRSSLCENLPLTSSPPPLKVLSTDAVVAGIEWRRRAKDNSIGNVFIGSCWNGRGSFLILPRPSRIERYRSSSSFSKMSGRERAWGYRSIYRQQNICWTQ